MFPANVSTICFFLFSEVVSAGATIVVVAWTTPQTSAMNEVKECTCLSIGAVITWYQSLPPHSICPPCHSQDKVSDFHGKEKNEWGVEMEIQGERLRLPRDAVACTPTSMPVFSPTTQPFPPHKKKEQIKR